MEIPNGGQPPFELQMEIRSAATTAEELRTNPNTRKKALNSFLRRMTELETCFPRYRKYVRRYGLAYASGIAERSGQLRQARKILGRALRQKGFRDDELAAYYCSQSMLCVRLEDRRAARRAAYRGLAFGIRYGGLPLQNLVRLLDRYGWGRRLRLAEQARRRARQQAKS